MYLKYPYTVPATEQKFVVIVGTTVKNLNTANAPTPENFSSIPSSPFHANFVLQRRPNTAFFTLLSTYWLLRVFLIFPLPPIVPSMLPPSAPSVVLVPILHSCSIFRTQKRINKMACVLLTAWNPIHFTVFKTHTLGSVCSRRYKRFQTFL